MSCLNPLPAFSYKYHDDDGNIKNKVVILSKSKYSELRFKSVFQDKLLFLPCGHCEACRLAYRKDWAVRCEMESLFHQKNCFITLTLDQKHRKDLPVKEDLQYFLHKLRDVYHVKCRYFACGELGSDTYRAHYHMILFGYKPDDLKFYGFSKSGKEMYTSNFLDRVWNQGTVFVNDFDFACAAYVAGYVKKDKNQCFIMESTRPGLGFDYMDQNFLKLFRYGHYQGQRGQLYRLPRYFKKLCDKKGYDPVHISIDLSDMMDELNKSSKFVHNLQYDGELNNLNGYLLKLKVSKLKREL